ncbi:MAG: large-conductance mechanosensitive channel protein MscL [Thermoanaerobaculia bacterium]
MSMVKEFREFAAKGNVVDMAVGIVIGAAFGKIVSSLVADVVMPPIGVLLGGVDFSDLAVTIKAATADAPAVVIAYGQFFQTLIDFIIIGFAVFLLIRTVNALKRRKEEAPKAPPAPSEEVLILAEIRDLLKAESARTERLPA